MRRPLFGVVLAAVLYLVAPSAARAQLTNGIGSIGADPFSSYYAWYLPNQAYMASQPRIQDTINAITVNRQRQAIAERDNPFESASPFDLDEEGGSFGRSAPRAGRRRGQAPAGVTSPFGGNLRGAGPPLYYSRTGRYFPTLRAGHGPNRNLAALRGPRGGGMPGMGGMGGGMGMGMPGPR